MMERKVFSYACSVVQQKRMKTTQNKKKSKLDGGCRLKFYLQNSKVF